VPAPWLPSASIDRAFTGILPRMSSASGGGTESVLAAAGWYPDSAGVLRWWDGLAWDMAKRGPGQQRTWAVLSHLSFFVLFLIPAIVLRVTVGRQDRFTRHHTTEALNARLPLAQRRREARPVPQAEGPLVTICYASGAVLLAPRSRSSCVDRGSSAGQVDGRAGWDNLECRQTCDRNPSDGSS
jgi:hypothetical protein